MRLACIYALLDLSRVVRAEHLMAALALWEYAERSVAYVFGDSIGDPDADLILPCLAVQAGGHDPHGDPGPVSRAQLGGRDPEGAGRAAGARVGTLRAAGG